jgi:ABC-type multidrug transport system ATPase subunit
VQAICDRVIVMAGGRVRLEGSIAELTRPAVPQLELDAVGPLEVCAAMLARQGIEATRRDATTLLVTARSEDVVAAIWQAARESGVAVRGLAPVRRGFEDVFLEAIAEDSHAAA